MGASTPPEMLVHVSDLLASTSEMTDAEFGLYLRLLFKEWMDGPIPDDVAKVARVSRGQSRKALRSAWNDAVRPRFRQLEPGKLINARLEATRNLALSSIESRKARSRSAATARWEKVASEKQTVLGAMLEQCSGIAAVMPEDMLGNAALSIESRDSVSSLANARSDTARRRSPRAAKEPDTSWVEPLREAIKAVVKADKRLCDLDADERFTLGRYHAWRWGNCKKSEVTNRSRATSIAAGIANLGTDRRFGALTVKDYISHAEAVWKERQEKPFFKPWDITARVEFEASS